MRRGVGGTAVHDSGEETNSQPETLMKNAATVVLGTNRTLGFSRFGVARETFALRAAGSPATGPGHSFDAGAGELGSESAYIHSVERKAYKGY